MTPVRWTTTVLSCEDPRVVAQFWAEFLSAEPVRITDDFFVVPYGSGWLGAQRSRDVADATWPAGARPVHVHLDIAVAELDPAVSHAVALGAAEEAEQPSPDRWRVMRAPGGHIFCLSHHIQDYLPVGL